MRRALSIARETSWAQRWWMMGWFGVVVLTALLVQWFGIGGVFISLPIVAGFAIAWLAIAIVGVVHIARGGAGFAGTSIALMTAVVSLVLAGAAFQPLTAMTAATVTAIRLAVHRPAYRAVLADLRTGRLRLEQQAWNDAHGVRYVGDAGPPVRVAFPGPGGFLDNWSGIVWDPTGRVMEADGWDADGRARADPAIRGLFGGDLVSCRHMTGVWYHCSFT